MTNQLSILILLGLLLSVKAQGISVQQGGMNENSMNVMDSEKVENDDEYQHSLPGFIELLKDINLKNLNSQKDYPESSLMNSQSAGAELLNREQNNDEVLNESDANEIKDEVIEEIERIALRELLLHYDDNLKTGNTDYPQQDIDLTDAGKINILKEISQKGNTKKPSVGVPEFFYKNKESKNEAKRNYQFQTLFRRNGFMPNLFKRNAAKQRNYWFSSLF